MHKLHRAIAPEPACLAAYDYRTQRWEDLKVTDKEQIRLSLTQLQDVRCAYCEGPVHADGHIEHFRRKNPAYYPQFTFVWSNLFLACGSEEHCGHYKDRPSAAAYNPDELVKPDEHDPDDYFYFHSSGEVRARSFSDPDDVHRAMETIRVFNLNHGTLTADRRRTLRVYEERERGILDALMSFDAMARQEFIADEVRATMREPHWTVIRHFFEKAH